jgi:hypothetical protein
MPGVVETCREGFKLNETFVVKSFEQMCDAVVGPVTMSAEAVVTLIVNDEAVADEKGGIVRR